MTSINRHFITFLKILACYLLTYNVPAYATVQDHEILVDFSFDTASVSDKTVTGYRLYKEGVAVCEVGPVDPQAFSCTFSSDSGTFDFSISALFDDLTESPKSSPFAFTLADTTVLSAQIEVSSLEGATPFIPNFDGSGSTGSVIVHSWTFGDGETASGSVVQHTYQIPGTYTASLKVTDTNGLSSEDSITITVKDPATTSDPVPPTVVISSSSAIGEAPLAVDFDGSGSTTIQTPFTSYSWDFGDGTSAQGVTVSHNYIVAGTYETTLTATDSAGLAATTSTPVLISEQAISENQPPKASITRSTTSGAAPLSISFSAAASTDSDGSITNYDWNFGDGTTASGVNVSHAFIDPGQYIVSLTATDDYGAKSTVSIEISVSIENNGNLMGQSLLPILMLLLE